MLEDARGRDRRLGDASHPEVARVREHGGGGQELPARPEAHACFQDLLAVELALFDRERGEVSDDAVGVATESDDTERARPVGEARARGDDDRVSFTRVPRERRNDTPDARVLLRRATHGGDMLARAEHPEEEVRARAGVVVRTLVDQVDGIRPAARAAHEEAPFGLPDDDAELFEVRAMRPHLALEPDDARLVGERHTLGSSRSLGTEDDGLLGRRVIRVS